MEYHLEVFYINRQTGWAVGLYDQLNDQQGEADYYHRKSDAIYMAKQDAEAENLVVEIYRKDGSLQERLT